MVSLVITIVSCY